MFRWEFAILEILAHRKGTACLQEMYSTIEQSYPLKDNDPRSTAYGGRPAYQQQVRSHVSNLVHSGALERIGRGCYLLIPAGRERYLAELAKYDPDSPLLRRRMLVLEAEVKPQAEGGYLAYSEDIQGCHAEGETVAEALANLEDVARVLLELRQEDGRPTPVGLNEFQPGSALRSQLLVPLSE